MARSGAIPGGLPAATPLRTYVVNYKSGSVTVVDVETGEVAGTISVPGANAAAAVPRTPRVYVASPEENTVTAIDTTTLEAVATLSVPGPRALVAAPDGSAVYISSGAVGPDSTAPDSVAVLEPATDRVVRTLPLTAPALDLALSPDGTRLYLSTFNQNKVTALDLATGATGTATVRMPGRIAVAPDGKALYVAAAGTGIDVVDTATLEVSATIAQAGGSSDVAVSPDGSFLYVVPGNSTEVRVVDTVTREVVAHVATPNAAELEVTPGGRRVLALNHVSRAAGTVSVIDTATREIVRTASVGITSNAQALTGSAGALPAGDAGNWQPPADLGGEFEQRPGAAAGRDGLVSVFAHESRSHGLYVRAGRPDGGWAEWTSLGEPIDGSPVAARTADDRLVVAFRAEGSALRMQRQEPDGSGFLPAATLADNLAGDPVIGFGASGRPEIFYEGTDGALWHVWSDTVEPDGRWSRPEAMGGGSIAGIATVRDGAGRQVFAHTNTSGDVWVIRQDVPDGCWGPFRYAFGSAMGDRAPALAVRADGRAVILVVGTDGSLWSSTESGDGWSEPEPLYGGVASTPSAVNAADGRLVVPVRGTDGALWAKDQNAPTSAEWSDFASLAPGVASDIVPVRDGDGRLTFVYRTTDGSVQTVTQRLV
ncbi:hypothetical protein GCM10010371_59880 [Streptomyces subrutilus]|uniref:PLL-like beta propeller domain-containing protein n=1 Tax=Streptomyces subrutilus TaxID=36818 RepID=A0A5P2USR0_9ACTN|nr:hypothetical protein [Streptomyces subrutilus]QEU82208.1 hypothetical protein CP968_31565 [Streptomyces subrutilus]GGZ92152.1 hypothetical protein GCM10010371_59880 [Streptomyces subrutilus]